MKKTKQITNNELAAKMDAGFISVKAQLQTQINELKTITNNSFTNVQEQLDDLTSGQEALATDVKTLQGDTRILKADMQDVKLRLGYHAPQFEVEELKKRVTRLEKKTGLA